MKHRNFIYYLGNFFIYISFIGLFYTAYPLVKIYFYPPQAPLKSKLSTQKFFLSIPKIHAYSEIIPEVDPWNAKIYNAALKKGIAHAKGTSLPGKQGSMFLFAHSSGSPWQITYTNTVFLRLWELNKNDAVLIDYQGRRFSYKVTTKKEVWPSEISYLKLDKDKILILQTCTPLGTALKRLLVFASLESIK